MLHSNACESGNDTYTCIIQIMWWAIGCLCSLSFRQSRAMGWSGPHGISDLQTQKHAHWLCLALAISAKIRYCQVTILTQCTKLKAVQPIGINWNLLDSASHGMCASMPRHMEQWRPFHIHVNLCHDIALDLSYLHCNCIIHCAATMCCWKYGQVHRFAVWTFTCPSWPGIRSGNSPWFPSVAQTWTTKYCEGWGCLTQWPRSTKVHWAIWTRVSIPKWCQILLGWWLQQCKIAHYTQSTVQPNTEGGSVDSLDTLIAKL